MNSLADKGVMYAAQRLGCSVANVYRLVESKQLPFVNVGASEERPTLRFLDEDLDAFIARRRAPAAEEPTGPARPVLALVGEKGRYR